MRKFGGLLLLLALFVVVAHTHAQGFLMPSPPLYGGFEFSYSRGGPGRGLRFRTGLFGVPPPVVPIDVYSPILYPPPVNRITYITIARTPPPILVLGPQALEDAVPPPPPPMEFIPPPPPPPPAPAKKEKPPAEIPRPPEAKADPADEHVRLVRDGQEAFKVGEYGRAHQRFRQTIRLQPNEAAPYFLLAQSLIALGKYHETHDAILAGLERDPTWPASRFRPLDQYDEAVAEYSEHLQTLENTLARHPDDPVLLFVYGHALWFDGRRDEAGRLFQRAREHGADGKAIERYLAALPAGEKL
jgi:tetratricopeptide (TPR) repeat protein